MYEDTANFTTENGSFLPPRARNVLTPEIDHGKRFSGLLTSCCARFHNERRWRVLLATVVCQLVASWPFCFGVFYHELLSVYEGRKDEAAFVLSVPMGLSFLSGIFVGPLVARFGSRVVVVSGSLLIAASFVLGFFANSVLFLILTIGVFGGIGSCMVNLGSNIAIGDHFDKDKDIEFSVASLGTSLGTLVITPLHAYVIPRYGLHGGLLITCSLLLHALPAGLVFAPRRSRRHLQMDTQRGDINSEDKRKIVSTKFKCRELFFNPVFLVWLVVCVIACLTVTVFYIVIVDFVVSEGISETSGALIATMPGPSGIVGRLSFGLISSKVKNRKIYLSLSAIALSGLLLVVLSFVDNEVLFYVISCMYGFAMAGVVISIATITEHLSKDEYRAEAFGLMSTAVGVGLIASGPFTGRILEVTGSYASVFIWNGSLIMVTCDVAAVIVVIINLLLIRQRRDHM